MQIINDNTYSRLYNKPYEIKYNKLEEYEEESYKNKFKLKEIYNNLNEKSSIIDNKKLIINNLDYLFNTIINTFKFKSINEFYYCILINFNDYYFINECFKKIKDKIINLFSNFEYYSISDNYKLFYECDFIKNYDIFKIKLKKDYNILSIIGNLYLFDYIVFYYVDNFNNINDEIITNIYEIVENMEALNYIQYGYKLESIYLLDNIYENDVKLFNMLTDKIILYNDNTLQNELCKYKNIDYKLIFLIVNKFITLYTFDIHPLIDKYNYYSKEEYQDMIDEIKKFDIVLYNTIKKHYKIDINII